MLRRSFLGSIAMLPGLGWLQPKPKNSVFNNVLLGKYVGGGYEVETYYDHMKAFEYPSLYTRWVNFPLEMSVKIKYEKGEIVYTAFNVTQEVALDLKNDFIGTFMQRAIVIPLNDRENKYCGTAEMVEYKGATFRISSIQYLEWENETGSLSV